MRTHTHKYKYTRAYNKIAKRNIKNTLTLHWNYTQRERTENDLICYSKSANVNAICFNTSDWKTIGLMSTINDEMNKQRTFSECVPGAANGDGGACDCAGYWYFWAFHAIFE